MKKPGEAMESYLFQYISKNDCQAAMNAFYACTQLHIHMLDDTGQTVLSAGDPTPFCKEFTPFLPKEESCAKQYILGSRQAVNLGEACFFCCHAGLYHVSTPIMFKTRMLGSVVAGPFLMSAADSGLILDLKKRFDLPGETTLKLYEHAQMLPVVSPELATQIGRLLFYLTSSLVYGSSEMLYIKSEQLMQQSQINKSVQFYKEESTGQDHAYPLEKENELINRIMEGRIKEALALLNDFLAGILVYENNDLEFVRIRAAEFCTLLSRAAIRHGADTDSMLQMSSRIIRSIMAAPEFNEICSILVSNLNIYANSLRFHSLKGNKVIKEITEYISLHFSEDITLNQIAEMVKMNPTYLSKLFRQTIRLSFKEYLNLIRIEEAKRLLINTDDPIMEIAVSCGYNDQSYFTKVFKQLTGMTPKQYR